MWSDDLDVFFDEDDFAVRCVRIRAAVEGEAFAGILGTVDAEFFDGQISAGMHTLHYPTHGGALQQGDLVRTQPQVPAGETPPTAQLWRVVRTPDRLVDGLESRAYLALVPGGGA